MKVKLLISRSGPDGAFSPGQVIAVSRAEAKRMFETVPPQAEPIRQSAKPERTIRTQPRKAVKKTAAKKSSAKKAR